MDKEYDMSELPSINDVTCPKCKSENVEGEVPHHPYYYHCECECGFEFSYDGWGGRYYTLNGDEIRKEKP